MSPEEEEDSEAGAMRGYLQSVGMEMEMTPSWEADDVEEGGGGGVSRTGGVAVIWMKDEAELVGTPEVVVQGRVIAVTLRMRRCGTVVRVVGTYMPVRERKGMSEEAVAAWAELEMCMAGDGRTIWVGDNNAEFAEDMQRREEGTGHGTG